MSFMKIEGDLGRLQHLIEIKEDNDAKLFD
jgi:hypothetical protein